MSRDESDTGMKEFDFEAMMAAMAMSASAEPIESAMERCPALIKKLQRYCPVKTAAVFGGLLLNPKFQKNCLRLEYLIHLAIAVGNGERTAPYQDLIDAYNLVGNEYSQLEDPPEDLFTHRIYTRRGNYLVIDGIWEGAGFYLQRFMHLVDSMPDLGWYGAFRNSIHALLKISNFICLRANLEPNSLGDEFGQDRLGGATAAKAAKLKSSVAVSPADLRDLGVELEDIEPFIFDPSTRNSIKEQSLGNSALERKPLAMIGDDIYLVLPTAISLAIRSICISELGTGKSRPTFTYNLSKEYSRLISHMKILGGDGVDANLEHDGDEALVCVQKIIDTGRYINLAFLLDNLEDFAGSGFMGMYSPSEKLRIKLVDQVVEMQKKASADPQFRGGINLIVSCGVGRGAAFDLSLPPRDGWKLEVVSAHDFYTLSNIEKFEPLNLWRMLEAEEKLQESNVHIQNMNGLLNLYAWCDSLNGHMVPHSEIPDDSQNTTLFLAITQNGLRETRQKVAFSMDDQVQQYTDGSWLLIRKEGSSYFKEEDLLPLYGSFTPGAPKGAVITKNRCWWTELASPSNGVDTASYDRWKMLGVWIVRAAPILDDALGQALGQGPIVWRCVFEKPQEASDIKEYGKNDDAVKSITATIHADIRTVQLNIGPDFDKALFNPKNIAERALVQAFVMGVLELAGEDVSLRDDLINRIVPNDQARYAHIFKASKFRDHFPDLLDKKVITINNLDEGLSKLNIGWKVRDRAEGGVIEGKVECQAYLNALVTKLEGELCKEVRQFNREHLVSELLMNADTASVSRDRWHRTASAVLSLRDDQSAALAVMRDYEFKLNSVLQPSRNLIEMAICESPVDGGSLVGDLDIARLLGKAACLHHLGGWSDLMRWDVMTPKVIIRPLGDVHVEHDFIETVVEDFGTATSTHRYLSSARNYAKNLQERESLSEESQDIDPKFLTAWIQDLGASFEDFCIFVDAIEDYAVKAGQSVLVMCRAELLNLAGNAECAESILQTMTLAPREAWRYVPDGYESKDIDPWRFKRQLSVVRRPLLQITVGEDPLYIIAPGIIREGFISTVSNYYSGSYPDRHCGPGMRKYAGYARDRDGMAFNTKVSEKLKALGWQTQPEIKLTKILKEPLDRNYGDVDVLAWDADLGRVLIIECKDLQFKKTYGEIAEQLNDFRGIEKDGKRDLLRKHLDRVSVLRDQAPKVQKHLNLNSIPTIESVVVFSNPVPMQFASGAIREEAKTFTFNSLSELRE
ncbi:zinc chelation protein SecC [Pseudomonas sp. NPDC089752]|uniref:zinc chelation protein SecC n=1 Tax=Pseudomonas sp. NPDC089752 TaxID=3364472 RepID=UPI003805073D